MSEWTQTAWREHLLPELDEGEVRQAFAAQFEAHERLQAWAWERRARPRSVIAASHHVLLRTIFARSTLTYRAIRRLCLGGYHQHADMLTRSLFEDVLTGYWSAQPHRREEAPDLLNDQFVYDQLKRYDEWRRLGLPGWTEDMSELEARRPELEKKFGPYGGKHWAPSLHKMLAEVGPTLPDAQMRYEFELFFRLRHRANNQLLHTTAMAIERTTTASVEGAELHVMVSQSPDLDEESILASLFNSMSSYGWLFRLVAVERKLDVDSFDQFLTTLRSSFIALSPSRRRQIGRNTICPCGSGRKYKACHGS